MTNQLSAELQQVGWSRRPTNHRTASSATCTGAATTSTSTTSEISCGTHQGVEQLVGPQTNQFSSLAFSWLVSRPIYTATVLFGSACDLVVLAASVVLSLMHVLMPQEIALIHEARGCTAAPRFLHVLPHQHYQLDLHNWQHHQHHRPHQQQQQHQAACRSRFSWAPSRPTYFGWSGRSWLVCQNQPS